MKKKYQKNTLTGLMSFNNIINNYILSNKEIIKNYICKKNNSYDTKNNCCSFYITKGKYKNTICKRKIFSNGYCKVHCKYSVESKEVLAETDYIKVELIEFECKGEKHMKTIDNIVYSNSEKAYYPVGYFDKEKDTIYYYE